jgi:CTP synthase (UTP-ammonia lyase)
VLGYRDADHQETNPSGERLVVTALSCSLVGQRQRVTIRPGTRAAALYGIASAEEDFFCSYGVNPAWADRLTAAGLKVSGTGDAGEMRIVELAEHPFFVPTLFLPQARSTASAPHPVLAGFAAAASAFAARRGTGGRRQESA